MRSPEVMGPGRLPNRASTAALRFVTCLAYLHTQWYSGANSVRIGNTSSNLNYKQLKRRSQTVRIC
jgi:hypothetical protein